MFAFSIATLCPILLILLGAFWGGIWGWLALGYMTVVVFSLDRLTAVYTISNDPDADYPTASNLLICLGVSHFALLAAGLWAVVQPYGMSGADRAALVLAVTLVIGQISHPVAHELIHKPEWALRLLGPLIYCSILFGHYASAHVHVHDMHLGSPDDPSSARRGEGFYRYALRAWIGTFHAGLQAENRARNGLGTAVWRHPFVLYLCAAVAMVTLTGLMAGNIGIAALGFIVISVQLQILMSDYVQHYGLCRYKLADGTLEPVGLRHSWNAPHWFSSAVTLNATRHSDHHFKPTRPFPALQLDDRQMPYLPHSMQTMALLALIPPLWCRIMDPICDMWQPGWARRPGQDAGNVAPPISTPVKAGGLIRPHLPQSAHADPEAFSVPVYGHHPGRG